MAIAEVWVHCNPCQGTGQRKTTSGGSGGDCSYCDATGKQLALTLDADFVDKINDIKDQVDAIAEAVIE